LTTFISVRLVRLCVVQKENVDEDVLRLGKGPYAVEVDIMEPIDPNKAPKVRPCRPSPDLYMPLLRHPEH
jgi:hypothetical protein